MTADRFKFLVAEALDEIPPRFARHARNVAVIVEDEPSPALLAEMGIEPPDTLFGLYTGTPLPERRWDHGNEQPDRILLFRKPIEEEAQGDDDALITVIAETLIHELGHFFGMSEEEIMAIEDHYWRGDPWPDDDGGDAGGDGGR
jgi:predicted Zn-dependent protease with MMP-like domain